MKSHRIPSGGLGGKVLFAAALLLSQICLAQENSGLDPNAAESVLNALKGEDPARLEDKAYLGLTQLPEIEKPTNPDKLPPLHPQAKRAFEQGTQLFEKEDYYGALNQYERAVGFNPKNPKLHRALALVYEKLDTHAKAFEHVEKAVELAGDDLEAQVLYGALALRRKQTQTAIKAFRTALLTSEASAENPRTAMALLNLGQALEKTGYYQAASECYAKLSEWVDEHSQKYTSMETLKAIAVQPEILWISQGRLQLELGHYEKATELLARAQKRDRSNRTVSVSLLAAYIHAEKLDQAQQQLLEMLREPALAQLAAEIAPRLLAKTRDAQMPGKLWKVARDNRVASPELAIALAEACEKLDKPRQALSLLQEAMEMHPGRADLAQRLGETYARMGEHLKALERFATIVRQNPQADRSVRRAIASVAGENPDPKLFEAVTAKAADLEAGPRSGLYYVAGRLAQEMEKPDEAAQLFKKAIEADSRLPAAYEAIVELYTRQGKFDEAEKLLEEVADKSQGHLARYLSGKLRLRRGDAAGALERLEAAHEANAQHVETKVLLAQAYLRTGREYEASQMFLSAANLAPGDPEVAQPLIRHYLRRRRFNQALTAATRLSKNADENPKALALLAEASFAAGETQQGQKALVDLQELAPDSLDLKVLKLKRQRSEEPGMLNKKSWDQYINQLNVVTFEAPNHVEAQSMLAELFSDHAKYSLAGAVYSQLARHTWQRPDIVLQEAVSHIRAGQSKKAVDALDRILRNDPESYSAKRLYIEALSREKDYKQAARILRKWLSSNESDPLGLWYHWSLIDMLEKAKDYQAAIAALDQWMEQDASDRAAKRTERIRLMVEADQYDKAVQNVEEWTRELDSQAQQSEDLQQRDEALTRKSAVRRILIYSLSDAGEDDRVLKLLDSWIGQRSDPMVEPLRTLRIFMLGEMDKLDQASRLAMDWISDDTTALAPRQALVGLLNEKEQFEQASLLLDRWKKDLSEIAESDPARADVAQIGLDWIERARILNRYEAKDFTGAMEYIEQALKESPRDAGLLQLKASCLGELGRHDQQTRIMEELHQQNPEDAMLNNNLGYYYADRGENLEKAEKLIRDSLQREPGSIATQDSLGWVLYKQGRFSLAGQIFLRIFEQGKEQLATAEEDESVSVHAIIFDHAGDTFYRLGWKDLALEAWRLGLESGRREEADSSDLEHVRTKTPGKIKAVEEDRQPEPAPYDQEYLEKHPETP